MDPDIATALLAELDILAYETEHQRMPTMRMVVVWSAINTMREEICRAVHEETVDA